MFDASASPPSSTSGNGGTAPNPPLILRAWDIFFSYTTYFERPLTEADFHRLAAKTVRSGLAEVTYHSGGVLVWYTDNLHTEDFDVDLEPYVAQDQATVEFPQGLTPYQVQCALHALQQRFHEKQSLSSMAQDRYTYFRAYLAPCELIIAGRATILYPALTVHRNGVLQVSFRVLNGQDDIPVHTLIDKYLTLPLTKTEDVFVPPALVRLDVQQILTKRGGSHRERAQAAAELKTLSLNIQQQQQCRHRPGADFGHTQVSVKALSKEAGPQVSLTMLVSMLFNAVEALANDYPARLGRRTQVMYRQGQFWSGRPHIYLRSTVPHIERATELAETHAESFGRILVRGSHVSSEVARKELGASLRLAEDYLSYVGRAASLNVYSAQGLRQHASPDPHGNELVYRLQAKADFGDFMAGSYWQCEEIALRHAQTVEDLIANREQQTELEHVARRPFSFGELNDWFSSLMDAYDIKGTRDAIALNTTLKLEKFKEERNLRRQQFQWLMAALLGIVASGTSGARNLVSMFWEAAGGPKLGDFPYTLIAVVFVSATLLIAYRVLTKPPSHR